MELKQKQSRLLWLFFLMAKCELQKSFFQSPLLTLALMFCFSVYLYGSLYTC
jgi:hypothetical protein